MYVTIDEVLVHDRGGRWHTVSSPDKTINLLELVNGVRVEIGLAELPAGHYTQMRLIIGSSADEGINALSRSHPYDNYVVEGDEVTHDLKVPSGPQTGFKIVGGFDINENETTELILDFDANKSVVMAGSSGKWLLKPTVKVLAAEEHSRVFGAVVDEARATLENVLVSARRFAPPGSDVSAEHVVETSTLSGDDGGYALLLQPASYSIVAYAEGYMPACAAVNVLSGSVLKQDFTFEAARDMGEVRASVAIASNGCSESTDPRHVTLSFRQNVSCGELAGEERVEVRSVDVGNGGSLNVRLPVGTYDVVATTAGELPQDLGSLEFFPLGEFVTSFHASFPFD